ncbi:hypothetical protein H6P81_020220 [Aristolochia fimbriata]|uniref:Uncharacterized protein n=1 Tax=Aristolochia fimbriata TaxID=158543 RepID=A0AAV7DTX8_ARIFI|nr:hypothetical protein H6P81_020220 [Aristolochia fimbriata]
MKLTYAEKGKGKVVSEPSSSNVHEQLPIPDPSSFSTPTLPTDIDLISGNLLQVTLSQEALNKGLERQSSTLIGGVYVGRTLASLGNDAWRRHLDRLGFLILRRATAGQTTHQPRSHPGPTCPHNSANNSHFTKHPIWPGNNPA